MSDSDESEENLGYYGKPLEPYDEDAFPKKKPISLEDQVATDEQGRRRFHGAFTGGFSAGFYNTVGSLEGWRPSEFKSSRSEKNELKARKPEDYMDDEDLGEFGIAPHMVQAKEEFSTKKKRKKETHSVGPIPGTPVLETLLEAGNETIGYLLLRNMGFKQNPNEIIEISDDDVDEEMPLEGEKKVYGCEIPKTYAIKKSFDNKKYEIPKVYEELLRKPKDNSFGLGYSGLDKSHINLFQPQKRQTQNLIIRGKSKRTNLNIQGQAFGVGAFEEEDDDIYVRDDMSGYDFELTGEAKASSSNKQTEKLVHDMFLLSTDTLTVGESFSPPTIPHSFTGKHKQKKSRFEPVAGENEDESPVKGGLNAEIRARYLGGDASEGKTYTASNWQRKKSKEELAREAKNNAQKMKKAEEFEDKQNKAMDTAAQGSLFDRFVSASKPEDISAILEPVARSETEHGTLQMREAARMKMFGPLTRETSDWQPCPLLCKRFNLPEPLTGEFTSKHERKRTKNLIFEFQKFDDSGPDLKAGLSTNIQEIITENSPDKDSTLISTECTELNEDSTEKSSISKESSSISSNTTSSSIIPAATPSSSSDILTVTMTENIDSSSSAPPSDIMNKINISQNQDLFRAIFADSSDDENDVDIKDKTDNIDVNEQETSERNELLKATVLSDELIPKIKPLKVGILSDINLPVFEEDILKISEEDNSKVVEVVEKEKETDLYGPKLPDKIIFKKPQSLSKGLVKDCDNSDEWVEKDEDTKDNTGKSKKKKDKKSKKHKKDKKHKKNKHKHKRR